MKHLLIVLALLVSFVLLSVSRTFPVIDAVKSTQEAQAIQEESPTSLLNQDVEDLNLSALGKTNQTDVVFEGLGATSTSVFALDKPSRVVVDLFGLDVDTNHIVDLKTEVIKGIRIGKHRDKTRVVLDLEGDEMPVFNFVSTEDTVRVMLKK